MRHEENVLVESTRVWYTCDVCGKEALDSALKKCAVCGRMKCKDCVDKEYWHRIFFSSICSTCISIDKFKQLCERFVSLEKIDEKIQKERDRWEEDWNELEKEAAKLLRKN